MMRNAPFSPALLLFPHHGSSGEQNKQGQQGVIGKWICFLVGWRFLATLLWQWSPQEARVVNAVTSLLASVFVLHLAWILLSRHVLSYRIQDYSHSAVWYCGRNSYRMCTTRALLLVETATDCSRAGWVHVQRVVGGESFWTWWERCRHLTIARRWTSGEASDDGEQNETLGGQADSGVEMIAPSVADAFSSPLTLAQNDGVAAPTANAMDRLEQVSAHQEGHEGLHHHSDLSPSTPRALQDKKKW